MDRSVSCSRKHGPSSSFHGVAKILEASVVLEGLESTDEMSASSYIDCDSLKH
jgi:hypothetical protein